MTTIDPNQPVTATELQEQLEAEVDKLKSKQVGKGQAAATGSGTAPPVQDRHPGSSAEPKLPTPSNDAATAPTPNNITNAENLISQNGVDLSAVENLLIKNNLEAFQNSELTGTAEMDKQIQKLEDAADDEAKEASEEMGKALTGMFIQIGMTMAMVAIAVCQPELAEADVAVMDAEAGMDASLDAGMDAGDDAAMDAGDEMGDDDDVDDDAIDDDMDDDDKDDIEDSDDEDDDDIDDDSDDESDDKVDEKETEEEEQEKLEKAKENEEKEKAKEETEKEDEAQDDKTQKKKQAMQKKIQTLKRIAKLTAVQGAMIGVGKLNDGLWQDAEHSTQRHEMEDQSTATKEGEVSQKQESYANQSIQAMQQAVQTMQQVANDQATTVNKIFS